MSGRIARLVARGGNWAVGAYAMTAAFTTYFCMYAFRKPFTAGTYELVPGWTFDLDFKIAAVIAQVVGYAISKLLGIRVVSEARPEQRAFMIFACIGVSLAGLVLFAVLPGPWKLTGIFLSGLPLGMIWGLVFAYLEGRRISEVLGAGLCASFIVSSGVVKSVGRTLIVDYGVPEFWMPAATGVLFMPVLAISLFLLAQTPPPDDRDKAERMPREPMYKEARKAYLRAHGPGLILLIVAYVVLTALRDFRDNFAVEIWSALGFADAPEVFTFSEIPVAVVVLFMLGATMAIRNNRTAVLAYHGAIIAGGLIIAAATLAFQFGLIDPLSWMIAGGTGIYLGYVPYNAMLFDRMTAALRMGGNAGFLIYLADASGYVGSTGLLLFKNFGAGTSSWLGFYTAFSYLASAVVIVCAVLAILYFRVRAFRQDVTPSPSESAHIQGAIP